MEKITINIVNVISDRFCTEVEDSTTIYRLIKGAIEENKKVILSFLNVEILTVAFLNTAIGRLYKHFSDDEINKHLTIENISASGAVILKRIVDTAKLTDKNPEAMRFSINDILGE